jgi:hypothetical protein
LFRLTAEPESGSHLRTALAAYKHFPLSAFHAFLAIIAVCSKSSFFNLLKFVLLQKTIGRSGEGLSFFFPNTERYFLVKLCDARPWRVFLSDRKIHRVTMKI